MGEISVKSKEKVSQIAIKDSRVVNPDEHTSS
jgi:hypothetical protein